MRINIPPTTRALLALTCFFTFLYVLARWNAPSTTAFLTLIPARFYIHPWTILTSTFVEQDVLNLFINITAVFLSGRYLERAWGSKDFAIVVLVATLIPNLLLIPTYIIWGIIFQSTTRSETPIAGAITLQAAFLVCFKQLVPEHTVSLYKGLIKTRVSDCSCSRCRSCFQSFARAILITPYASIFGLLDRLLPFKSTQHLGSTMLTGFSADSVNRSSTFPPSFYCSILLVDSSSGLTQPCYLPGMG